MKRFLSLFLSLMLLLPCVGALTITTTAMTNACIEFSSAEGKTGDTVILTLSLKGNPGIAGLTLSFKYDTAALTVTDVKKGSLFSDFAFGKNYVWDESKNVTTDGSLATVTFKISEQATAKDYPVSAIVRTCTNADINDVECNVLDGKITVKQKPVPVTGLALDKTSATVKTGDKALTLTPVFTPNTATNKALTWKSSDNSVATVADGVVTLIKKGNVTITATTKDGNYSASCVVTINCSHLNSTDFPLDASTCNHHGHNAYTVCNDCGDVISGSNAELPFANHTGGTATCEHKAVCSVCKKEYGELDAHKYVEKTDAKYLKDAASCTHKAVYYKSCSVCGEKSNETFEFGELDPSNHEHTEIKKVIAPTCTEKGYTIYKCNDCKAEFNDSFVNATGHNVENWTITKEATLEESGTKSGKCTVCGKAIVVDTGKLIKMIPDKNIEGNISAALESVDGTKIYEGTVFSANIVTDKISGSDKESLLIKISGDDAGEKGRKIVGIVDLSMIMREKDTDGEAIKEIKYQPNGKVRVTLEIPEEWFTKFKNVSLSHLKNDGSVEKINYKKDGKLVTFETSELSNYVFTGESVEKDSGKSAKNNNRILSPKTGDTANIYFWASFAVVFISVLIGTVINKKRKMSR